MSNDHESELDLVWGAEEIGRIIRRPARTVYYQFKRGQLPPVRQVGRILVASRRKLLEFLSAGSGDKGAA